MSDMRDRAAKWLEDNKSYYDGVKVGSLAAEFQRIYDEAIEAAALACEARCESEVRACEGHAKASVGSRDRLSPRRMHTCAANQSRACGVYSARDIRALKSGGGK